MGLFKNINRPFLILLIGLILGISIAISTFKNPEVNNPGSANSSEIEIFMTSTRKSIERTGARITKFESICANMLPRKKSVPRLYDPTKISSAFNNMHTVLKSTVKRQNQLIENMMKNQDISKENIKEQPRLSFPSISVVGIATCTEGKSVTLMTKIDSINGRQDVIRAFSEGDTLLGWKVSSVSDSSIVFYKEGQKEVLDVRKQFEKFHEAEQKYEEFEKTLSEGINPDLQEQKSADVLPGKSIEGDGKDSLDILIERVIDENRPVEKDSEKEGETRIFNLRKKSFINPIKKKAGV